MPQIQKNSKPTATTVRENKSLQERLRDRYAPTQYVRVINIDNEPFDWQYFPIDGEIEEFTDNGAVRVTTGRQAFTKKYDQVMAGNEQLWSIEPGESEVLLGANADLFIMGLYKRIVAKGALQKFLGRNYNPQNNRDYKNKPEVNFNWNDGLLQEQMIDQIFLGVERPNFDGPRTSTTREEK